MRKFLCFCTGLTFLFIQPLSSQELPYRHPSTLGVHLVLYNFGPLSKSTQINQLHPGLSLRYLKGLSSYFDLQVELAGAFPDSTFQHAVSSEPSLLLQSTVAGRLRFRRADRLLQPFVLSGLGLSHQEDRTTGFALIGTGLAFNLNGIYLTADARYHATVSEALDPHFTYSFGIAGPLSRPRKQKPALKPLPDLAPVVPDRDKDGIVDTVDHCPDLPGLVAFQGCPDTDGDGIPDDEDQCPVVPGSRSYGGCPIADQDKDGISDSADQCPAVPGTARYNGCPVPDTDGDGVNDEEDQCIAVPGLKTNGGCPVAGPEVAAELNKAASQLFFQTGRYELLPESFQPLKDVIRILNTNRTLMLTIEGHTDAVGNRQANQVLSENRARAVASYLIQNGVSESRLTVVGYGMQRPIDSNETAEGRSRNRRVELKINP